MPYKVNLTRKTGSRTELSEIHRLPTPKLHEEIIVPLAKGGSVHAKVTGIMRNRARLPKASVDTVDVIEAREK
jgi:hypothetical protein